MNDLKHDYDYNEQIKLVQAKSEARQLLRKIKEYRQRIIVTMNGLIELKKVTHRTKKTDIEKLARQMTALNRQCFIYRKMLSELMQARRKIMSVKNKG